MAGLPDVPSYDTVIVDVPASLRWQKHEGAGGLSQILGIVATALDAVFVQGMDEDSL